VQRVLKRYVTGAHSVTIDYLPAPKTPAKETSHGK